MPSSGAAARSSKSLEELGEQLCERGAVGVPCQVAGEHGSATAGGIDLRRQGAGRVGVCSYDHDGGAVARYRESDVGGGRIDDDHAPGELPLPWSGHRRDAIGSAAVARSLDPRPSRFEQGVVAFVLLVGFTFQVELLIPAVTALLALSGALGPGRALLPRLFAAATGDHVEPADNLADAQTLRLTVTVQTGVLLLASLLVFLGVGGLAWFIALVVVATSAFNAATGTWIEAGVYWRLARRRRP
jgi:hypothetical protein